MRLRRLLFVGIAVVIGLSIFLERETRLRLPQGILISASDRRSAGDIGRQDSLHAFVLIPEEQRAVVVSIPRNLFVDARGYRGIIAAYSRWIIANGGDGDAALLEEIGRILGGTMAGFVEFDFGSFRKTIDALGGIDLYVPCRIDDAFNTQHGEPFFRIVLSVGWHHLDGELALRYARTRHHDDDFTRAARQQLIVDAALEQAERNPVGAARALVEVASSARTDLSMLDLIRIARFLATIPEQNIRGYSPRWGEASATTLERRSIVTLSRSAARSALHNKDAGLALGERAFYCR